MKLSLCMIVKNEENQLEACLDAVKEYVDEIIIADTGSTDDTKVIASKFTNKIYDFIWCNDFAKARNFSISKANNDWVLVLDADEVVIDFDKESVIRFMKSNPKTVGRLKRINPFEDGNETKRYIERVNRLFNKNLFSYEGIIHEQIVARDGEIYSIEPVDIVVDHVGYLNEVIKTTNKLERNISLLLTAINDNPNDPYLYYQIGKSYYKNKEFEKANECFEKSINLSPDFRYEYAQDLVESYGYSLIKCGSYSQALNLKKYNNYYGKSPDYNFVMGLIYMNNAMFEDAIKSFKKCIGADEGKIEGINTYQPNYNIGVIYETLGHRIDALRYYSRCGDYKLALDRKAILIINQKDKITKLIEDNMLNEGKMLLRKFMDIYKDAELYCINGVINMIEGAFDDALFNFNEGLKLDINNKDILFNLDYLKKFKK